MTLGKELLEKFQTSGKKHLIITGSKKTGKTTRIEALTQNKNIGGIGGIRTWAEFCGEETPKAIYLQNRRIMKKVIAATPQNGKMAVNKESFDKFATNILKTEQNSKDEFVVVDEIGFLEKTCESYQIELKKLFKKKRVIAAIRKDCLDFYKDYFNNEALIIDLDKEIHKKIACLVLAAGRSERFNGNKLLADFMGKSVIERTIESIDKKLFDQILVVTSCEDVKKICKQKEIGCKVITTKSISESIRKGISELESFDGLMIKVADQPLLKKETLEKMTERFLNNSKKIVRLSFEGKPSSPSIFPDFIKEELLNLKGDVGGKTVIKNHSDDVIFIEAKELEETIDVDTTEKLEHLIELYRKNKA